MPVAYDYLRQLRLDLTPVRNNGYMSDSASQVLLTHLRVTAAFALQLPNIQPFGLVKTVRKCRFIQIQQQRLHGRLRLA